MSKIIPKEKLDAIIKEYSRGDGYYDGIPPCVTSLTDEEFEEYARMVENGELEIERKYEWLDDKNIRKEK